MSAAGAARAELYPDPYPGLGNKAWQAAQASGWSMARQCRAPWACRPAGCGP